MCGGAQVTCLDSIRQQRQHTSAEAAYVSIRQERQHTYSRGSIRYLLSVTSTKVQILTAGSQGAVVPLRGEVAASLLASVRGHTLVSMRQHASEYVSMRQHSSAYLCVLLY
jgi:hypothetical protein